MYGQARINNSIFRETMEILAEKEEDYHKLASSLTASREELNRHLLELQNIK